MTSNLPGRTGGYASLAISIVLAGAGACGGGEPATKTVANVSVVVPDANGSPDASEAGGLDPSAASRQVAAWLAAFNAGDEATLLAYHEQSLPFGLPGNPIADLAAELAFRGRSGGFDQKTFEELSATRVVAIMKERASEQFARLVVEVDAHAPTRVTRFEIRAISTPDEFRPARVTEAEALAALHAELARAVAADQFAGAVLVAKNGKPIFSEAHGLADRERKQPNKLDTRFRIGSMNKMFTAVAVLQLVQAGKLALTDSLAKIVPDYPNQALASKVTLHHLLTHTGGTGDIFGPEFDAHRLELKTVQDYVKLYGKRDLEFEPGAKWQYSNYGFVLLGAIIERVTRQSYYDAVAARVFKPAGMTATSSPPEDRPAANRSVGYTRADPQSPWASAATTLPYRGSPAGGGDATVGDLLRFANAITAHKLLDAAHTALLTEGKVQTPGRDKYAYGFVDTVTRGLRCSGHGGGAPGMNGQLSICESGYTIAILANLDPPAASRLAAFIGDRLPAK